MSDKQKINKRYLYIFIAIALIATTSIAILPASADPALPAMTLTVTGADGTTQTYDQTALAAMPVTSGTGNLRGSSSIWTGVDMQYLYSLVGGTTTHSQIRTLASDGYILDITTNPDGSLHGLSSSSSGDLPAGTQMIIAYYINSGTGNQLLDSGSGPLRSAVLQTAYTSGFWFNKHVTTLQISGGKTALTLSNSADQVDKTTGQTTTLSGALTTADTGSSTNPVTAGTGISGKTIHLYRSDATLGWVEIGQATTTTGGAYTFNWAPDASIPNGSYQFKAVYNKDNDYFGSSTQTATSVFVLPEYTLGALAGFVACFAAFVAYLAIKKNGCIPQFSIHKNP